MDEHEWGAQWYKLTQQQSEPIKRKDVITINNFNNFNNFNTINEKENDKMLNNATA